MLEVCPMYMDTSADYVPITNQYNLVPAEGLISDRESNCGPGGK